MMELLDEIARQCNQECNWSEEKKVSMFRFALAGRPKLLEAAMDFLDEGRVIEYRTIDSSRTMWKITSSKDAEYIVS